ncbi:MAG: CHAD domain-containing protein [Bryobacteraceae bacterium]|nr:CHAD domain-containing protein [Bryobacteraceae bacterium]
MTSKQWRGKQSVGDNLRTAMPQLADEWFTAGDEALVPGRTWDEIHQFRLLTKRFRYTLEIFRPAYGPSMVRRIEQLRGLQGLLGEINDAVVTAGLLADFPGNESNRKRLLSKADKLLLDLFQLWAKDFSPATCRAGWKRYLKVYADRPKRVVNTQPPAPPAAPEPLYTET